MLKGQEARRLENEETAAVPRTARRPAATQVGIVGASGYTGRELLRLLLQHPRAQVRVAASRSGQGRPAAETLPHLSPPRDLVFSALEDARLGECDAVFFATPQATAMHLAPGLLERGARVIDLSADFRLSSPRQWQRWYAAEGERHACPERLAEAVYGLPEWPRGQRERIARAALVANPGCYPTAVLLALAPLLEQGAVSPRRLIVDAKSGVSGAGRRTEDARLLYAEAAESMQAYSLDGHRHLPEIRQALESAAQEPVSVVFVPHLAPMRRGILATIYAEIAKPDTDFQALLEERYAAEPFVEVLPPGGSPATGSTWGSNSCRIAVHRHEDRLVLLSAIDNLVKGAAGQAVQNMNLMFGHAETDGLNRAALCP